MALDSLYRTLHDLPRAILMIWGWKEVGSAREDHGEFGRRVAAAARQAVPTSKFSYFQNDAQ